MDDKTKLLLTDNRYSIFETKSIVAQEFISNISQSSKRRLNLSFDDSDAFNEFFLNNKEVYGLHIKINDHIYFSFRLPSWKHSAICRVSHLDDDPEILINPNNIDKSGRTRIGRWTIDSNGEKIAVNLHVDGRDEAEIAIFNIVEKVFFAERLKRIRFTSVVWERSGKALLYNSYPTEKELSKPEIERKRYSGVYRHFPGSIQDNDTLVFDCFDEPDTMVFPKRLPDSDVYFLDVQRRGGADNTILFRFGENSNTWKKLSKPPNCRFELSGVTTKDKENWVYFISDHNAPNREVLRIQIFKEFDHGEYERIIANNPNQVIERMDVTQNNLFVTCRTSIGNQIRVYDLYGLLVHDFNYPSLSVFSMATENQEDVIWARSCGLVQDFSVLRISAKKKTSETVRQPASSFSMNDALIRQIEVPTVDGETVPLSLYTRNDQHFGTNMPCMITGYGGFGMNAGAFFDVVSAAFVASGGLVAVAHVRGGGEKGQSWHEAGKREKRLRSVEDFLNCTEMLIEEGLTNPQVLAARGASNGGLLVAAAMARQPELFAAVICESPVIDMLRYDIHPTGKLWRDEYGSPEDPTNQEYLLKLSPLDNLPILPHPPILICASENDERLPYWHATKYAAALTLSGPSPENVFLRLQRDQGHSNRNGAEQSAIYNAGIFSFLTKSIGMSASLF